MACSTANQCYRSNRNTFVYDRNSILLGNILSRFYQIFSKAGHLIIYILTENIQITVGTVQQVYSHSNGTYIQIFFLYHLIGFENLGYINHSNTVF